MRQIAITLLVLLGLPAAAQAGSIHLTGTAGPAAEVFPQYRADPGERNRVKVMFNLKGGVTITDTGVRFVRAEKGKAPLCKRRGPRKFFCPHMFYVEVRLGDRNDSLHVTPSGAGKAPTTSNPLRLGEPDFSDNEGAPDARTFLYGGKGNDKIIASSLEDDIFPGPGRDEVQGRGARDTIFTGDDGVPDAISGQGGLDSVYFTGNRPVSVDLENGGGGGDKLEGIERVHGTPKDDRLIGGPHGDALYGEGGNDTIDGRGGNDLITPDSAFGPASANTVAGGDGDDVIDALGSGLAPGSTFDCGPGTDRVAAGVDDLLPASCESAVFTVSDDFGRHNEPLYSVPVMTAPVASDTDGQTFEVRCPEGPAELDTEISGCKGTLALESPPVAGSSAEPTDYGSSPFDVGPGQSAGVRVELNSAGRAARAGGSPVAVHITATLAQPGSTDHSLRSDFGWEVLLPPAGT